jgi:hypothetical protein
LKTKIIKLKNGSLEIVLCGAIHIGTQNYFNQLNAIANECDIVLFEGVSAITLDKFKLFYVKLGKLIGLSTQNRIGYENSQKWINSDMNYEIFKYYMKKNVIEELNVEDIDETIKDFAEKDKKFIRWIILFLIKNMNFISMFIKENHILVRLRNYKVLVDATKQFETHNKIAVVYGNGHLNHLIRNFKKLNFVIIEKSYLNSLK